MKLLFPSFKRRNRRLRNVEQTAKTIERGSGRGRVQNEMSSNPDLVAVSFRAEVRQGAS